MQAAGRKGLLLTRLLMLPMFEPLTLAALQVLPLKHSVCTLKAATTPRYAQHLHLSSLSVEKGMMSCSGAPQSGECVNMFTDDIFAAHCRYTAKHNSNQNTCSRTCAIEACHSMLRHAKLRSSPCWRI